MSGGRVRRGGMLVGLALMLGVSANCGSITPRPLAFSAQAAPGLPAVDSQPGAVATPGHPVLSADGIYVPDTVDAAHPIPVLLALHGMGGNGQRIAERLRACADANGWVVVAPTMNYRNYMDPRQVLEDEAETLPWLLAQIDDLPRRLVNVPLASQVLLYGFSRGAQMAQRFAFFYPDRVAGAAVLSGGNYTVPRTDDGTSGKPERFPYGVADLQQYTGRPFDSTALRDMPFWVGVGMADNQAGDVPRDWDPLLGTTRLERGHRLAEMLRGLGADVTFDQFAGVGHDETATMRDRACDFLASHIPLRHRS